MIPSTEPQSSGTRRVSQVVLLLDSEATVLSVNRSLAGTVFSALTAGEDLGLHHQLHPNCRGDCHFNDLWRRAWRTLSSTDGVEWEVDDPVIERLLRINLAKPPAADGVVVERRRGHALLIMTDITKHRREYESLIKRERQLMRIVREQEPDEDSPANDDDASNHSDSIGQKVIRAQELERKRIASELHDGIAQSAGVIKYNIEASLDRLARSDPSLDLSSLEDVVEQTRSLLEEVRRISGNLAPSMLDDFGLCVALQSLCDEFRSDTCDFQPTCSTCLDEAYISHAVKIVVYRVVQEALNNISKHASATVAKVEVSASDGRLVLQVSDNGMGFEAADVSARDHGHGSGLHNMRERVESSGGEFSIQMREGGGTIVRSSWSQADIDLLSNETVLDGVNGNG